MEEEGRKAFEPQPFGSGIADAVSDYLSRGRVRQQTADRATAELFAIFGAAAAGAETPPPVPPPQGAPWYTGIFEQARQRAQPPPPDPDEIARRRARSVLGFGAEPLTAEMIKDRRRELAKQNHPDRGGSAARMAEINDAADVLLAVAT